MRKKLIGAVVALCGAALLGVGGTYAGFVASEDSSTAATADTLFLELSTAAGAETGPIVLSGLLPGDVHSHFVRVGNGGTIPGRAAVAFRGVQNFENGCLPPELEAQPGDPSCGPGAKAGELGDQLSVAMFLLPDGECGPTGGEMLGPPTFPADNNRAFERLGTRLMPDETRCVRTDITFLDLPRNNVAQGDSTTFRLDFRLVQ